MQIVLCAQVFLRFLLSILCDAHKHEKWQKLSSSLSLNKHSHHWTVFIATYFKQNKDSPYENLFFQQIVSKHDFIFIHWFPTDFKCTIISILPSNTLWWSKSILCSWMSLCYDESYPFNKSSEFQWFVFDKRITDIWIWDSLSDNLILTLQCNLTLTYWLSQCMSINKLIVQPQFQQKLGRSVKH